MSSTKQYIITALESFSECNNSSAMEKATCLLDKIDAIDLRYNDNKRQVLDTVHDIFTTKDCNFCPQLDGVDYDLRRTWQRNYQSLL